MDSIEQHITVATLAELLDVHHETARKLVCGGHFPNAVKVGRDWRIPESDVAAYLKRNQLAPKRRMAFTREGT